MRDNHDIAFVAAGLPADTAGALGALVAVGIVHRLAARPVKG